MPQIAAFMGVMGSGKDYQAKLLCKSDPNWVQIDFKDALIDMCEDLVGFPVRDRYDEFKEFIVGFQKPHISLAGMSREDIMGRNVRAIQEYPLAMTGRRMLQRLGTDVMRKRDPDYWASEWAKKAIEAIYAGKSVCCGDCRFLNEMCIIETLAFQSKIEGVIRFCDYRSKRYNAQSEHVSEQLAQLFLAADTKDLDSIDAGMARHLLAGGE